MQGYLRRIGKSHLMSQLQGDLVAVGNISAPADAVEMVQDVLLGGGGSRDVEHVTRHS